MASSELMLLGSVPSNKLPEAVSTTTSAQSWQSACQLVAVNENLELMSVPAWENTRVKQGIETWMLASP